MLMFNKFNIFPSGYAIGESYVCMVPQFFSVGSSNPISASDGHSLSPTAACTGRGAVKFTTSEPEPTKHYKTGAPTGCNHMSKWYLHTHGRIEWSN